MATVDQKNAFESMSAVFNNFGTRIGFVEDSFSTDVGVCGGDGFTASHQMQLNCHFPPTERVLI